MNSVQVYLKKRFAVGIIYCSKIINVACIMSFKMFKLSWKRKYSLIPRGLVDEIKHSVYKFL